MVNIDTCSLKNKLKPKLLLPPKTKHWSHNTKNKALAHETSPLYGINRHTPPYINSILYAMDLRKLILLQFLIAAKGFSPFFLTFVLAT